MIPSDIFATAFDSAGIPLVLLDNSGRILEANRAFVELCGRPRDQIVGEVFWDAPLAADPQAAAPARAQLETQGRLENTELPLLRGDGSLRLLEVTGREIGGGSMQLELRDITARQGRRTSQRQAAQRQLASRAAAEFAGLQQVLQSASAALAEYARRGESTLEPCRLAQKAAETAGTIAQDLQACGGSLPFHPERLNVNELIAGMHLALQRRMGPGIEVLLDLSPEIAPVLADPSHLREIVLRLAANSREAMDHGVFRIETSNILNSDRALGTLAHACSVMAISDDGPGLDDQSWDHIYEPFCTTRQGKRGLGLAAVHGLVTQNGGRIWAQSQSGHGTTFRIYLPQVGLQTTRTILLMEPDDGLRGVLSGILKRRGYRVLPAREPREALALARSQGPPDLLISEPAPDLARHLESLQPGLRTLFLNGHAPGAAPEQTLVQPFQLDELLAKVRELVRGVQ